jgi:hypothetical protein
MRKILIAAALLLMASGAYAQTATPTPIPTSTPTPTPIPTYSPGQENVIRNTLVPAANRAKCASYAQPICPLVGADASLCCNATHLAAAGCVPTSIAVYVGLKPGDAGYTMFNSPLVETCQTFPSTAAGQAAVDREAANRRFADDYLRAQSFGSADFKARWLVLNQTVRDNLCTGSSPTVGLGLAAGCSP